MVLESGAYPTQPGAEAVLEGELANGLDQLAARWHQRSRPIMKKRDNNK
ncbi:MAG: hypothetical protein U5K53_02785 [Halanaerobiales bacterium]|nr:hypothetical protein [Halanaerobiales bacterium]